MRLMQIMEIFLKYLTKKSAKVVNTECVDKIFEQNYFYEIALMPSAIG